MAAAASSVSQLNFLQAVGVTNGNDPSLDDTNGSATTNQVGSFNLFRKILVKMKIFPK